MDLLSYWLLGFLSWRFFFNSFYTLDSNPVDLIFTQLLVSFWVLVSFCEVSVVSFWPSFRSAVETELGRWPDSRHFYTLDHLTSPESSQILHRCLNLLQIGMGCEKWLGLRKSVQGTNNTTEHSNISFGIVLLIRLLFYTYIYCPFFLLYGGRITVNISIILMFY